MKKYHYVYEIINKDTLEFYFGVRSCNMHPKNDSYMGYMSTWNPDKEKLIKRGKKRWMFDTGFDAEEYEKYIISKYIKHPKNRNAHIPNIGFSTEGCRIAHCTKTGRCRNILKDDVDVFLKNNETYELGQGYSSVKDRVVVHCKNTGTIKKILPELLDSFLKENVTYVMGSNVKPTMNTIMVYNVKTDQYKRIPSTGIENFLLNSKEYIRKGNGGNRKGYKYIHNPKIKKRKMIHPDNVNDFLCSNPDWMMGRGSNK